MLEAVDVPVHELLGIGWARVEALGGGDVVVDAVAGVGGAGGDGEVMGVVTDPLAVGDGRKRG